MFFTVQLCVVCDYSNPKLKNKQYKQKTSPKSYKIEIKILAINLGLGLSGFEQPDNNNHELCTCVINFCAFLSRPLQNNNVK